MFFKKKDNDGQGMPELIAAVGIVVFALASIISLTMFSVTGQRTSEGSVIAMNLAREGIEIVRNIRDTAWLKGDSSPFIETTRKYIANFNETSGWGLEAVPSQTDVLGDHDTIVCNNDSGQALYYDQYSLGCGGEYTKFARLITIDLVCSDDSIVDTIGGTCAGASIKAYRVKSEVTWYDKGDELNIVAGSPQKIESEHVYELVDYLYAWK